MRKKIVVRLAGIDVGVKFIHSELSDYLRRYESGGKPQIKIGLSRRDIKIGKRFFAETATEGEFPDWYYEAVALQRAFSIRAAERGVLLLHASALSVDGEAYLFAAPSGTGKSTHARLWRKLLGDRAVVINDDKPFVKVEGDRVTVYGSPWSGKHRLDNNISVPLKGICFLEQGTENRIVRLSARDAFARLCKQVYFPADRKVGAKVLEGMGILLKYPLYQLTCDISEDAARLSFQAMKEEIS